MSNKLLSLAWKLALPATEKVVLAALADCADDAGITWLAVRSQSGKLDLITMTSLSERAIQGAIKSLVAGGHISRVEAPGRGVTYTVHPRTSCAPAPDAPPHVLRPAGDAPTPAPAAGEPSVTPISSQEASPPSKARARAADPFPRPDWADAQHWADFLANRKRKKLPNTATAYARFLSDVDRLADADWPPGRILQHAAERGWAGIYDPRGRQDGNGTHHNRQPGGGTSSHPGGRIGAASDRVFGGMEG